MMGNEFEQALAETLGLDWQDGQGVDPAMDIALVRNEYGRVDWVELAFAWPGYRMQILLGGETHAPFERPLWIDLRPLAEGAIKNEICALVDAFLREAGYEEINNSPVRVANVRMH